MCSYLEWQLNVEPTQLTDFEVKVKRDFKGPGPYPSYSLPSPAPSPMPSTTPYGTAAVSVPSFVHGQGVPTTSPPKSAPRPPPPVSSVPAAPHQEPMYLTPPSSPSMPPTPEASHSTSTSPASSVSPPTPPGHQDFDAKIVTPSGSMPISMDSIPMHAHHQAMVPPKPVMPSHPPSTRSQRPRDPIPQAMRRPKCDLFALAAPVMW